MLSLTTKKYKMLSFLSRYTAVLMFVFALAFSAFVVNACGGVGEPACQGAVDNSGNGTPAAVDNTQNQQTPGLTITNGIKNPLGNGINDIPSFIETILNFVLLIGVPIVALAIIYSGFLFVTAAGNSEKLTKAKKTLLYTIVGAALLLGSFVIAKAIKGTVDDIKSTT